METTQNVRLEKIATDGLMHAATDTKAASRYTVYIGDVKIGEVASHSEESWDSNGRIRTRMRGYTRTWFGGLGDKPPTYLGWRRCDSYGYTRRDAVNRLVEAWNNRNRNA